jgi:hypothetical protein
MINQFILTSFSVQRGGRVDSAWGDFSLPFLIFDGEVEDDGGCCFLRYVAADTLTMGGTISRCTLCRVIMDGCWTMLLCTCGGGWCGA